MKNYGLKALTLLCTISVNLINTNDVFDNYMVERTTENLNELKESQRKTRKKLESIDAYSNALSDKISTENDIVQKNKDLDTHKKIEKDAAILFPFKKNDATISQCETKKKYRDLQEINKQALKLALEDLDTVKKYRDLQEINKQALKLALEDLDTLHDKLRKIDKKILELESSVKKGSNQAKVFKNLSKYYKNAEELKFSSYDKRYANIETLNKTDSIKTMWRKKLQENNVLYRLNPRLYNWWYSK